MIVRAQSPSKEAALSTNRFYGTKPPIEAMQSISKHWYNTGCHAIAVPARTSLSTAVFLPVCPIT